MKDGVQHSMIVSVNSRFRSPNKVPFLKDKRFDLKALKESQQLPGPGEYISTSNVNSTLSYFNNKYKVSGGSKFGHDKRLADLEQSETRKITPGPGSYMQYSDFMSAREAKEPKFLPKRQGRTIPSTAR